MAAGETPPPPVAPEEGAGKRRKLWVLAVVAVLIVAALGGIVYLLSLPSTRPPSVALDHVTLSATGSTTADQGQSLLVSAKAFDTTGVDQTRNASFAWSATPASAVTITSAGSNTTVTVAAIQGGSVSLTATATWKSSSKSGSLPLTINALHFDVTATNYHPILGSPFILKVRVARSDNSNATSYTGKVNFTSTDATATLPPTTTYSIADLGSKTFNNVIIRKPGAVTITATDTVLPITGSATFYGDTPPVVSFTVANNSANPLIVTFTSTSYDPDGAAETASLTYSWNFGDGSPSATTQVATHTYSGPSRYTITLTVADIYFASNRTSVLYYVHTAPHAAFQVTAEALNATSSGVQVTFDASTSTGGDGTLKSYAWTFGDSSTVTVSVAVTFHNYSMSYNGRSVNVGLTVMNSYTLTNVTSSSVPVSSTALPPVASFTLTINNYTRTVGVDGSASKTPTGQAITYYNWTWGDGSAYLNTTSPTASHAYASDNSFTITLTVVNTLNAKGSTSHVAMVKLTGTAPVAVFNYTRNKLAVTVDASQTYDLNGNLAWLTWTWGDGSPSQTFPSSQVAATHTYASAGFYQISLVANDSTNLHSSPAVRYVSVATSTIDYKFYDFFNVSYGDWWDMRTANQAFPYGDEPLGANCFNASSLGEQYTNGKFLCYKTSSSLPNGESYPYADWYPSPAFTNQIKFSAQSVDPFIYAPYRLDVVGVNQGGYNVSEPVFLPVRNYTTAPADTSTPLTFDWYMQYLNWAQWRSLDTACGIGSDDGYMLMSWINVTLSLQESKRIFGVPIGDNALQAASWWGNPKNAVDTCSAPTNSLNAYLQTWFAKEANGKYDIVNEYQAIYTSLFTRIKASVDTTTGMTRVTIGHAAWGTEALLARWFYWGNASYVANYLDSRAAKGWWGMELAWLENMHFSGTLTSAASGGMNFHLNAVQEYHFQTGAFGGPDGYLNRIGDIPDWRWGPWLSDYVYTTKHVTELDRWTGLTYLHSTPGGNNYNDSSIGYDYAPLAWKPKVGETWHFLFPVTMAFFNPNIGIPQDPHNQTSYIAAYKLAYTQPTTSQWTTFYDPITWIWDVYGGAPTTVPWPGNYPNSYPGTGVFKAGPDPSGPWGSITFVPASAPGYLPSPTTSGVALSSAVALTPMGITAGATHAASATPAWTLSWAAVLVAMIAPIGSMVRRHEE